MEIINIRVALFYDSVISRPDVAFKDLNTDMGNVFDAIPTSIPVPDGIIDVPIQTLKSSNNKYLANLSRNRIDLVVNEINSVKEFEGKILKFVTNVIENSKINSFGFVGTYYIDNDNANKVIQNKYFKFSDKDMKDMKDIGIKYNKPLLINDHNYNCHINISSVTQQHNKTNKLRRGILITKDINNIDNITKNKVSHNEANIDLFDLSKKILPLLDINEVEDLF